MAEGIVAGQVAKPSQIWNLTDQVHWSNITNKIFHTGSYTNYVQPDRNYTETFFAISGDVGSTIITANTTGSYIGMGYTNLGSPYDDFSDATTNSNRWQSGIVSVANTKTTGGSLMLSINGTGGDSVYIQSKTLGSNFIGWKMRGDDGGANVTKTILLGTTTLSSVSSASSNTMTGSYFVSFDKKSGRYNYYKNNVLQHAGLYTGSEFIRFRLNIGVSAAGSMYVDDVFIDSNGLGGTSQVQTGSIINAKNNIIGVHTTPYAIMPSTGTILQDISVDSGATWGLTNQALGSYIDTSSLAGSLLALRFQLSGNGVGFNPVLKGYSTSVWV